MTQKSSFQILDFNENPNVGVYCRANDTLAFLQTGLPKATLKKISETLDVEVLQFRMAHSTILGSLIAMNNNGIVVSNIADVTSLDILSDQNLNVYLFEDVINAAGNDVLANDNGALVHPNISDESFSEIKQTLGVPTKRGTIAGLKTVGMAAAVTNKGCLCHPKATREEIDMLTDLFDVEVMIGTVNHGDPMVGSGLIANSTGVIIGNRSTGIEMGRIEEALKLY